MSYSNLHRRFGWSVGVHRAPAGYEHPWLAVGQEGTEGAWSRAEARQLRRRQRELAPTPAQDRHGRRGG